MILEGTVSSLSDSENEHYWQSNPRVNQIRFTAYAPISSQVIADKLVLENRKKAIELEFADKTLPISPHYCGFRLYPTRIMFYTIRKDVLSDVFEYRCRENSWEKQWLSP